MLILTRRKGQKIMIGNDITIVISDIIVTADQTEVKLGIEAPKHITVDREEVREQRINRISSVMPVIDNDDKVHVLENARCKK